MHKANPNAPAVLVADDDPDIRTFISHVLTDAGYQTRTAMDVLSAVGCLRSSAFAAVILDMLFVNSNGRSGLDLLHYIRSKPELKGLPVIILTGFPLNHTVVEEVESLGADLWHKPFDDTLLVQRLSHLIFG